MNEEARIKELYAYHVLDSIPEREFDEIVALASAICNTPIAQISLVDARRQWIKATHGILAQETPREYSFCSHALNSPNDVMIVNDSYKDDRFKHNPLVIGEPRIRFYAGSPLTTASGNVLGTLCVIDTIPRALSEEEKRALQILSKKVVEYFDLRKKYFSLLDKISISATQLESYNRQMETLRSQRLVGTWRWNKEDKKILWSPEMVDIIGIQTNDDKISEDWKNRISPVDFFSILKSIKNAHQHTVINKVHQVKKSSGEIAWVESEIEVKVDANLDITEVNGRSIDVTLSKKYTELLEEVLFSISHSIRRPISTLQGLVYLLTNHEQLNEKTMLDYTSKIKFAVDELNEYTSKLTKTFLDRRNAEDA